MNLYGKQSVYVGHLVSLLEAGKQRISEVKLRICAGGRNSFLGSRSLWSTEDLWNAEDLCGKQRASMEI